MMPDLSENLAKQIVRLVLFLFLLMFPFYVKIVLCWNYGFAGGKRHTCFGASYMIQKILQ